MFRALNIIFSILIIIFFLTVYKYYSSTKLLESRDFNRNNIDQIINTKISNLPILDDDTNNVITFNDGFSNKNKNEKPRSF